MNDLMKAATVHLMAACHDCQRRHEIRASAAAWLVRMSDWAVKHAGHRIEFWSPRRTVDPGLPDRAVYPALDRLGTLPWWLTYAPNTDFLVGYAASAAFTITLASLASSSTFLAGRESDAVSNTTNKYLDYLVGGKVTTGTSPTASKTIRIYGYGSIDDTPTYPDVLDGADSAETITSADILNQLALLAALGTDNTSDRTYWMAPRVLSLAFGGVIPKNFGLYIAHDTAVALNATGGNHAFSHTGAYVTG